MNYTIRNTVWVLAPMVMALALAMDIYVPAVPRLAELFNVSAAEMQLTLNLFMLTSGIMQLIIGPLSDQFGRRSISFMSIFLYAIGSLCCALSFNAPELVLSRVIQAAGAVGMMVTGFAMVRDRFQGTASAKTYSYLNGIIAFSPMFAPFVGSYLTVYFGWRTTFLALLIVALWAFLSIYFAIPESLAKENRKRMSLQLLTDYKNIFLNPIFLLYTFATAIGLSYLFLFCSISPYIIIRLLHIPELHYGYYFAFMGISFFVGSLLSGYFVGNLGLYRTVMLGFLLSLLGGLVMTVWFFISGLSINNFIWPMLLIGIGGTFGLGAGSGGLMEPFGHQAGTASALSGAIRFLFSAVIGALTITRTVSSTLPLAVSAVCLSLIGLMLFMMYKKKLG